jgi:SAM-dependent methyltransferase
VVPPTSPGGAPAPDFIDTSELDRCPVCGATGDSLAATVGALVVCRACTHAHRPGLDVPTNEVFESGEYVSWRAASVEHRRIAEARIEWVTRHVSQPGRSLEIGCSAGEAVAALAGRGWDAYGLDLSALAIGAGRDAHPSAHLGVGRTPSDAGFPDQYDLVLAFHLVEHVPDLTALAADVRSWLRPGGWLAVRVPNWASWSRAVSGERWPCLMPEHVHQFTPSSMQWWLSEQGFDPVHVGTEGRAREWLGAARRATRPRMHDAAGTSELVASPGRLRAVRRVERVARPWFALEEAVGRGSELVVLARLR